VVLKLKFLAHAWSPYFYRKPLTLWRHHSQVPLRKYSSDGSCNVAARDAVIVAQQVILSYGIMSPCAIFSRREFRCVAARFREVNIAASSGFNVDHSLTGFISVGDDGNFYRRQVLPRPIREPSDDFYLGLSCHDIGLIAIPFLTIHYFNDWPLTIMMP
jgi:hypothetical protein